MSRPIPLDECNRPAEELDALAKAHPWLAAALGPVPPAVASLVVAAQERAVEIIGARRAAELEAVVLADGGGAVPVEEAYQVGGEWFLLPEWLRPPARPVGELMAALREAVSR